MPYSVKRSCGAVVWNVDSSFLICGDIHLDGHAQAATTTTAHAKYHNVETLGPDIQRGQPRVTIPLRRVRYKGAMSPKASRRAWGWRSGLQEVEYCASFETVCTIRYVYTYIHPTYLHLDHFAGVLVNIPYMVCTECTNNFNVLLHQLKKRKYLRPRQQFLISRGERVAEGWLGRFCPLWAETHGALAGVQSFLSVDGLWQLCEIPAVDIITWRDLHTWKDVSYLKASKIDWFVIVAVKLWWFEHLSSSVNKSAIQINMWRNVRSKSSTDLRFTPPVRVGLVHQVPETSMCHFHHQKPEWCGTPRYWPILTL